MAQRGPVRILTTVVELIAKSKAGLRQLNKDEASVKRHAKALRKIDRDLKVALLNQTKRSRESIKRAIQAAANDELARKKKLGRALERDAKRTAKKERDAKHRGVLLQIADLKKLRLKALSELRKGVADNRRSFKTKLADARRYIRRSIADNRRHVRVLRNLHRSIGRAMLPSVAGVSLAGFFIGDRVLAATARAADEAAVLAQQLGFTAQQVQALMGAGELAGVKSGFLATALRRMGDNAGDAARGAGMAVPAFEELGITIADLNGPLHDNMALLEEIVKRSEGLSPRKLGNIQAMIFGRAGAKAMGPLGNLGFAQLKEWMDFVKKGGAVIGKELTDVSQRLIDQFLMVRMVLRGMRNDLAKVLIPLLTAMSGAMVEWWLANRKVIVQKLDFWMQRLGEALEFARFMLDRVSRLVNQFSDWGTVFSGITASVLAATAAIVAFGVATAAVAVGKGTLAVWGLGGGKAGKGLKKLVTAAGAGLGLRAGVTAAGAAAPAAGAAAPAAGAGAGLGTIASIAAIILAAIAAIGLAFEDLFTFFRGGERSITGRFLSFILGSAEAAEKLRLAFSALFGFIGAGLKFGFTALWESLKELLALLGGFFQAAFATFASLTWAKRLQEGQAVGAASESLTGWLEGMTSSLEAQMPGGSTTNNSSTVNQTLTFNNDPKPAQTTRSLTTAALAADPAR